MRNFDRSLAATFVAVAVTVALLGIGPSGADAAAHRATASTASQCRTQAKREPSRSARVTLLQRCLKSAANKGSAGAQGSAGTGESASIGKAELVSAPIVHPTPAPTPTPVPLPVTPAPAPEPTAPAASSGLVIGIDGGWSGWGQEEINERVALGASVTRHEWSVSEPVTAQDSLVYTAAAKIHTRIHALLGADELGNPTHYREFVVSFIRRYGVGGTFWSEHPELDPKYAMTTFELGNEPYFGGMSATEYAATVRPVLEEVKALNLPAKIVLASRVYGSDVSWIETLYRNIPNLNSLYYALAEHPYWNGHAPSQQSAAGPFDRIETTRRTMNAFGAAAKPIFISEYGESTGTCGSECVSEATQAQHLQEMIQAVLSHPEWRIGLLSLFQLNDYPSRNGEREGSYGLLRTNGTPKPAYAIVHQAVMQHAA